MMKRTLTYIIICCYTISVQAQSRHAIYWSKETKHIWENLRDNFLQNNFYIGMHNDGREALDEQGILQNRTAFYSTVSSRKSTDFKSDFQRIAGAYPTMTETDFHSYAINRTDIQYKESQKKALINYIIHYHNTIGGLSTISCHMPNPWWYEEKEGDAADFRYISSKHPNVVAEILDGKTRLNQVQTVKEKFDEQLDEFIQMLNQLKDYKGKKIPVVIRLFHEASGDWFWWGDGHCSHEEYKQLFRYTVEKITKNCNHVIIGYTPDRNWNSMEKTDKFMNRYPGNEYVDIIGFDNYGIKDKESIQTTIKQLRMLSDFAKQYNKVVALTETGNNSLTVPNWFTQCLEPCVTAQGVNLAYVEIYGSWSSDGGFFFPYKKNSNEAKDFRKFYKNDFIIKGRNTKKVIKSVLEIFK